jgi:AcrR family transcriptional regulator
MRATARKESKKKGFAPRKDATQDRSRATIERILETTWEILGTDGAKAVTTRNIAARSGVTIGSIYQYFPHKESILLELYKQRLAQVAKSFREITTPELLARGHAEWQKLYIRTFDELGWNRRAQAELDKACHLDPQAEKLLTKHLAHMQVEITALYRKFFPHLDDETVALVARYVYGLERFQSRFIRAETGRCRELALQWSVDMLNVLLQKFSSL